MRLCVCLYVMMLYSCGAFAQQQNNNWMFNTLGGIGFGTGAAMGFNSTFNGNDAPAIVSDRHTGSLLFYSDGEQVWTASGSLMPNGAAITPDIRVATQGCVIVPDLSDSLRYYIFTLENYERDFSGKLYCTIVDMRLNNGSGDVLPGTKGMLVGDGFSEMMTTVPGNDCNIWLVVSRRAPLSANQNRMVFWAYSIGTTGISNTPVISSSGRSNDSYIGCLKISPDRKHAATTSSFLLGGTSYSVLTMHDFDPATGMLYNDRLLRSALVTTNGLYHYRSCEFSPDSRKLYISMSDINNGWGQILQYDASQAEEADIVRTEAQVSNGLQTYVGNLQRAADGEIYIITGNRQSVSKITDANNTGRYVQDVITFPGNYNLGLNLPQLVVYPTRPTIYNSAQQIITCFGKQVQLQGRPGAMAYHWGGGERTAGINVSQTGVYWVASVTDCNVQVDSFRVKNIDYNLWLGDDTLICKYTPLQFSFDIEDAKYLWQDGDTSYSYVISQPGQYWLRINASGCIKTDTLEVTVKDPIYFSLGSDTTVCPNLPFLVSVPDTFDHYKWSDGSGGYSIAIPDTGTYWLRATNNGCDYSDTLHVQHYNPYLYLGNDTTLCLDDTLMLDATSLEGSVYRWNDMDENPLKYVIQTGVYHVEVTNQCGVFTDTLQAMFEDCSCRPFIPTAFTPNGDGRNDGFMPIVNCKAYEYKFMVVNRFGERVFITTTPGQRWDGSYKGMPCDVGTYFYMLFIKGPFRKDYLFKGDVILIR